jgi:microcystin-dependent protein
MIAFAPHATNGATVTLNVDGLGAKPLRSAPGVELQSATIIQGTPYAATYNNASGEWLLHGYFGNFGVPLLGGIDYWGITTPSSSFIFPAGQPISRSVYAAAFAIMGTTFGAGDGSTTFNVPDKRGRVSAAWDNGVGRFSPAFGGVTGTESTTLAMGNLPASPAPVTATTSGYSPTVSGQQAIAPNTSASTANFTTPTGTGTVFGSSQFNTLAGFSSLSVGSNTANLGSATPFSTAQPTIVCNYIMRII